MTTKQKVQIGEHGVELRFTLGSVRRLKEALGMGLQEIGEKIEASDFGFEEGLGPLTWAFIAHVPELRDLTVEDVEGMIELDDFAALGEAIRGLLYRQEGSKKGPPPAAPRKRAKPRRKK